MPLSVTSSYIQALRGEAEKNERVRGESGIQGVMSA